MKQFERVLFCVERLDYAGPKLRYVGALTQIAKSREVHLLHVQTEPASAPGTADGSPRKDEPVTIEGMKACVDQYFAGHGHGEVICQIAAGSPLLEVLRYAHDQSIDLIVLGRLRDSNRLPADEATFARRVTRKATCSVLVLPVDAMPRPEGRIVVPVRESDCSANALERAFSIGRETGYEVMMVNVFQVHSGYSNVGLTLEEYEATLKANAEDQCRRLLERLDPSGVEHQVRCVPDRANSPAETILEIVRDQNADIVVIGARGLTGAAGVLLGNTTSHLIQRSPVPVLAVKKKGECIGIVQALLTIAGQG